MTLGSSPPPLQNSGAPPGQRSKLGNRSDRGEEATAPFSSPEELHGGLLTLNKNVFRFRFHEPENQYFFGPALNIYSKRW